MRSPRRMAANTEHVKRRRAVALSCRKSEVSVTAADSNTTATSSSPSSSRRADRIKALSGSSPPREIHGPNPAYSLGADTRGQETLC